MPSNETQSRYEAHEAMTYCVSWVRFGFNGFRRFGSDAERARFIANDIRAAEHIGTYEEPA